MKEPQTTIEYRGRIYPFYKTNRGNVDFENAGFTNSEIAAGKTCALLALVYYHLRESAKRAGMAIKDSFEEFIDNTEPEIITVFTRLNDERIKLEEADKKQVPAYTNEAQVSGEPGDARALSE
jgi:hypothetical protein